MTEGWITEGKRRADGGLMKGVGGSMEGKQMQGCRRVVEVLLRRDCGLTEAWWRHGRLVILPLCYP